MLVLLDTQDSVILLELSDFRRLSLVTVDDCAAGEIDTALKNCGAGALLPDRPGHVGISIDWLRSHFSEKQDLELFDAMAGYADGKGWLTTDRSMFVVHYTASAA